MPCWTERVATVELLVADRALLRAALTAAKIEVRERGNQWELSRAGQTLGTYGNDSLQLRSGVSTDLANEIKREYSKQVVLSAGKRFGWTVTQQADQMLIQRRF